MRCPFPKGVATPVSAGESFNTCKHSFILLTAFSNCKGLIRKLLIKDELRRLGSRAGASDVKGHLFFRQTQWALLRHSKPPIIPNQGRGVDTVNFRNVKESHSVDLGGSKVNKGFGVNASKMKGVPLDSNLATPGGEIADPFEEFNSVTLHHDGDDQHHDHQYHEAQR